jgi:hypothetical protein
LLLVVRQVRQAPFDSLRRERGDHRAEGIIASQTAVMRLVFEAQPRAPRPELPEERAAGGFHPPGAFGGRAQRFLG